MEKDEKVKWMKRFEIIYDYEKQGSTIDEFLEYCRAKGYNRVAGIRTLLDMSKYHTHIMALSDAIVNLNKEVAIIKELLNPKKKKEKKKPVTIGGES